MRLVDEAYAAGRISAVDRGLRVEQVEAAATRGDLAMVVRDLLRADDATTASVTPDARDGAPPEPVEPVGAAPGAPDGTSEAPDVPAWPPPGYQGREVTPADVRSGPSRRAIGCIIAAVVAFFLLPIVFGMVALVFGLAVSDSSSGGDEVPDPAITSPF
jgi:hypothetical protein